MNINAHAGTTTERAQEDGKLAEIFTFSSSALLCRFSLRTGGQIHFLIKSERKEQETGHFPLQQDTNKPCLFWKQLGGAQMCSQAYDKRDGWTLEANPPLSLS